MLRVKFLGEMVWVVFFIRKCDALEEFRNGVFLVFGVSLDVMFALFFFHPYNAPAERSAALLLSY